MFTCGARYSGAHASQESFVSDSGRWRVKLSDGAVKDLKAENLRILELKQAEIPGERRGAWWWKIWEVVVNESWW